VQVEVEALEMDDLRQLIADAVASRWDDDAYETALEREVREEQGL
jgi:hypothetical protein